MIEATFKSFIIFWINLILIVIYFLGWLDDLKRFQHLISLNLADNDLKTFPLVICHLPRLVELNLASNGIDSIPSDIEKLQK